MSCDWYYLQDLNYFYLVSNLYQEAGYFAKRNKAILNDNILFGSLGKSDEIDFYSLDRKTSNIGNINLTSQYLNIIIALDQQISNFNRAVYSFFDTIKYKSEINLKIISICNPLCFIDVTKSQIMLFRYYKIG